MSPWVQETYTEIEQGRKTMHMNPESELPVSKD